MKSAVRVSCKHWLGDTEVRLATCDGEDVVDTIVHNEQAAVVDPDEATVIWKGRPP